MIFSDEDKILIKRLYLKGYTAKMLTDEFPEKSWTKHGVSKLFKKLQDTGTVNRRPVRDHAVPPLKKSTKLLLVKFLQSVTDFGR